MPRPKPSTLIDAWVPEANWMDRAACHNMAADHPDLFFPLPEDIQGLANAKRVCHDHCSVRLDCLEYALSVRDVDGVWGGFSEKERAVILRNRRKAS